MDTAATLTRNNERIEADRTALHAVAARHPEIVSELFTSSRIDQTTSR